MDVPIARSYIAPAFPYPPGCAATKLVARLNIRRCLKRWLELCCASRVAGGWHRSLGPLW